MGSWSLKIQNPKIKDQNKSQDQRPKIKPNPKFRPPSPKYFWILKLGFGICFGFWILSFGFLLQGCGDVDATLSTLSISPSSATVGINQSQNFTTVAQDSTGKIVFPSPTWSLSGSIGSISSSGIFTAGSTAGTGTITATYGGKSASATVTVTQSCWIEGRVTDSSGNRVESMKVYLQENTSLHDFTDSSGDYSISDVPAGTYVVLTLEIKVYKSSSREVTVASGETETADFTISYFTDPIDLNPPTFD